MGTGKIALVDSPNPISPPMPATSLPFVSYSEKAAVLVPTYNPGPLWPDFLAGLYSQTSAPAHCWVLDSESTDGSLAQTAQEGLTVHTVERKHFNHGGTRQWGIDRLPAGVEFVVFLTQDAVLTDPEAIGHLLSGFSDPAVAAVYGRQLPHPDASQIAAHARHFNYPAQSQTRRWSDKDRLGLKACFLSNSFAAYRLSALREVGGFSPRVILGEDTHLAARLLQQGHAIRYEAQARVYHSHNYSLASEFARYFDTGVFHHDENWMIQSYGKPSREGLRFLKSEIFFLVRHAPWRLPEAMLRTALKALAYRLGCAHTRWPLALKKQLSMHKGFWA
jgi:rhamnosyltransferase